MTMNSILSDISEEMSHRIPPNIDPLKKYATYIELIQKITRQ